MCYGYIYYGLVKRCSPLFIRVGRKCYLSYPERTTPMKFDFEQFAKLAQSNKFSVISVSESKVVLDYDISREKQPLVIEHTPTGAIRVHGKCSESDQPDDFTVHKLGYEPELSLIKMVEIIIDGCNNKVMREQFDLIIN